MKGIMELLGTAMFLSIVAFILFLMYQRNTHTFAQWGNKLDKYATEADQVSQKVDRVAKALPRIYKKMKDEVNDIDDPAGESVEETVSSTPPPAPQPKPTVTVEPRFSAQPPINHSPRPEVYNTATTAQRTTTTTTPKTTPIATTVATVQLPSPTAKGAYKIQVGRLTEGVNGVLFNQLQTMGVVSYQNNGSDQVVLLGNYATKADADKVLTQVRKVGFKDAFVKVPSAGSTASKTTTNTEKCNCPKQGESANTSATTITTPANGKVFVVQLGASQFPVLGKAKSLSNWGKVYTDYNAQTDLTKIMLGSFATPTQADAALQAAKKIGFSKAFVKNITATDMKNWKVVQ